MGPELWVLIGGLAVASSLGAGVWVGWSLGASALELCEYERDTARADVEELREQAVEARAASAGLIATERSMAAVSSAGPTGLVRLLDPDGKAATAGWKTDGTTLPNAGPLAEGA